MSAIIAVLHLLKSGDHLLVCQEVYGGAQKFINDVLVERYKVEVSYVDFTDE